MNEAPKTTRYQVYTENGVFCLQYEGDDPAASELHDSTIFQEVATAAYLAAHHNPAHPMILRTCDGCWHLAKVHYGEVVGWRTLGKMAQPKAIDLAIRDHRPSPTAHRPADMPPLEPLKGTGTGPSFEAEKRNGIVRLRDRNVPGTKTLTNDMEHALEVLNQSPHPIKPGDMVIYRDTEGQWDQVLINEDCTFKGFRTLDTKDEETAARRVKLLVDDEMGEHVAGLVDSVVSLQDLLQVAEEAREAAGLSASDAPGILGQVGLHKLMHAFSGGLAKLEVLGQLQRLIDEALVKQVEDMAPILARLPEAQRDQAFTAIETARNTLRKQILEDMKTAGDDMKKGIASIRAYIRDNNPNKESTE